MAKNRRVDTRERYVQDFSNLDFSGDSEVTVTMSDPKWLDDASDVRAFAYGSGGAIADEGRVAVPVSVSGSDVTLHSYFGGGAGAPLDDDTAADVDHVTVEAIGL